MSCAALKPFRDVVHCCAVLLLSFGQIVDAQDAPPEEPIAEIDQDHWSLYPLTRPAPPDVSDPASCRTPIDRFILSRLEEKDLHPSPDADRLTLLRRATFDLTGLPPTIADADAFLADESPDAYERLVDRLLNSTAYGERWAQHWLDLARFAETDGFEFDHVRPEAWRYRDWVIEALNADMPFDQFVAWQLAGDLIAPHDPSAHIATGYLLCGPDMPDINLQDERRHVFLNGMTANVGEVFLAMRMGCAECHDHKTDPISQYDFYRLRAYFESLDLFKDHPLPSTGTEEDQAKGRTARNSDSHSRSAFLWIRGDFRRRGPTVEPAPPRVVTASFSTDENSRGDHDSDSDRRALAEWITSPSNPLTARVIANRIWQHHFGRGLAATPNDFGIMGDAPTHPELLDWLACELVQSGWSVKHLHRVIMTSTCYRAASRSMDSHDAKTKHQWSQLLENDPDNRLFGRARRRRLEGESIRDALLAASGQLNREAYGPGVRPPLPYEVTVTLLKNQWPVTTSPGASSRRSVYLFSRRNLRYPLFEVFDKPDTNQSCPERSITTIAPQALHLLNSEFALICSEQIAAHATVQQPNAGARIEFCYRQILNRWPTQEEQAAALAFLSEGAADEALADLCLALMNSNEFAYLD